MDAVEKDNALSVGKERKLSPFVPCNRVELVSEASDEQSNKKQYIDWLKNRPLVSPDMIDSMFENPKAQPREVASHQVLQSPSHKAMLNIIRNAQHTLFLNVMLFGGVWGAEIAREMLLAKIERGVQIVFLRDAKNLFWFKPEIEPVWSRLVSLGARTSGVTVLRADTLHRAGELPFMIDILNQIGGAPKAVGGDLAGTSDHSKVLIADGFEKEAVAFVTSKNFSDYNAVNYDEGVVIRGPAAGMLQLNYMHDFDWAMSQAQNERPQNGEPALQKDDFELWERWKAYKGRVLAGGASGKDFRYPAQGSAGVRILENNADNSVRNLEHGILTLLASAQKSVRMYGYLAYNPMLTKAFVDAEKRLGEGNVRMILDGADMFVGNQIEHHGIQQTRYSQFRTPLSTLVRWRKLLPSLRDEQVASRIAIVQEQHVKSIIVDERYYLAGSANFDLLTQGGAFRETSVVVDDSVVAKKAAQIFDSIWENPSEIISFEELSRQKPQSTFDEKSNRFLFEGMADEQRRIRSLNPRNIVGAENCMN